MNQRTKASQANTTSFNLMDMGWVVAHGRAVTRGRLLERSMSLNEEAMVKACGVTMAKPQGHSWAPHSWSGSK